MVGGRCKHEITPSGARRRGRGQALGAGLVLAVALRTAEALAGAWTLPEGGADLWLQTTIAGAASAFGPGYELRAGGSYHKVEQNVLLEYGAADGLTALFATQFLGITLTGAAPAQYAGPGYSDFGARLRLWQGEDWVVSVQAVARAPGASGSASRAAVGYTDWEADLRLLAGRAFRLWGQAAFLDLQVAQRERFGAPPSELRVDATLGVEVLPGWQMLLQSFNVISEGAGAGPDFGLSYAYYKAQAGVLVAVDARLTVEAAAFTTYLARNFPQENGLVLAARYRF